MLEFGLYSRSDEESLKLVLFLFVCSEKIHFTYWENMKVEAGRPGRGGGDGLAGKEVQVGRRDGKRLWEQRVDGDL